MGYTLEVCVDSIESALAAAHAGADRIELASCLDEGGVTPSYGLIQQVCRKINTTNCKVHVLIRPRGGDFVYSEDELHVITSDVIQIASLGAHGVVLGFLHPNGTIDTHLTTKYVELSSTLNLDFTFHRAFDVRRQDQRSALECLIDCGVPRVLTSGGHPKAFHALEELSSLVKQAEGRILIMPGGGIDEENAVTILKVTGATDIHGSFRHTIESSMQFLHPRVHFSSTKIISSRKNRKNMSELHGRDMGGGGGSQVGNGRGGEDEEGNEDLGEYTREELVDLWSRRVASEEKIRKVKESLEALIAAEDEEEQRHMD